MSTTGIIEIDSLIDEARDEANREIGRLTEQNKRLRDELERALTKLSAYESADEDLVKDLIESAWNNDGDDLPDYVDGERADPFTMHVRGETIRVHERRRMFDLTIIPY
jgi:hypothetical protein